MPRLTKAEQLRDTLLTGAFDAFGALDRARAGLSDAILAVPQREAAHRDAKASLDLHTAERLLAAHEQGVVDGKNAEIREAQFAVYCAESITLDNLRLQLEATRRDLENCKASLEAATALFTAARYGARLQAAMLEMVAATAKE